MTRETEQKLAEALGRVRACIASVEGIYGFDDDKPVDTRHFGPLPSGEQFNTFAPLTWGDLRAAFAAPVSVGDGEAVAWRFRDHPDNGWIYTGLGGRHDGCEVQPLYTHPSVPSATERMRAGDLLWYDMGEGVRIRCTYHGDCEGWPLVTFDADKGSDAPQPVRPSRLSARAALGEA